MTETLLTVANLEIAVREAADTQNGWKVVNIKTFQASSQDGMDANGVIVFDRTQRKDLPDRMRFGTARWACEVLPGTDGEVKGRVRFFSGNYDLSLMEAMIDFAGRKA